MSVPSRCPASGISLEVQLEQSLRRGLISDLRTIWTFSADLTLGLDTLHKCRNRHLGDGVCYGLGDRRCHSRFGKPTMNRSKRSQNRACPTDHDARDQSASAQEYCTKLSEPGKSR